MGHAMVSSRAMARGSAARLLASSGRSLIAFSWRPARWMEALHLRNILRAPRARLGHDNFNLHRHMQVRHSALGVIIGKQDLFLLPESVVTAVNLLDRGSRSCSLLRHRYERRKKKNAKEGRTNNWVPVGFAK